MKPKFNLSPKQKRIARKMVAIRNKIDKITAKASRISKAYGGKGKSSIGKVEKLKGKKAKLAKAKAMQFKSVGVYPKLKTRKIKVMPRPKELYDDNSLWKSNAFMKR